jgi:hypothetical protein
MLMECIQSCQEQLNKKQKLGLNPQLSRIGAVIPTHKVTIITNAWDIVEKKILRVRKSSELKGPFDAEKLLGKYWVTKLAPRWIQQSKNKVRDNRVRLFRSLMAYFYHMSVGDGKSFRIEDEDIDHPELKKIVSNGNQSIETISRDLIGPLEYVENHHALHRITTLKSNSNYEAPKGTCLLIGPLKFANNLVVVPVSLLA